MATTGRMFSGPTSQDILYTKSITVLKIELWYGTFGAADVGVSAIVALIRADVATIDPDQAKVKDGRFWAENSLPFSTRLFFAEQHFMITRKCTSMQTEVPWLCIERVAPQV
jgi:hypothetical protein